MQTPLEWPRSRFSKFRLKRASFFDTTGGGTLLGLDVADDMKSFFERAPLQSSFYYDSNTVLR